MKKLALGLACCAALFGSAAFAKEVRLASDFTYPPFNYKNADGTPVGFDIEIADALCAQAKLECTWVSQSWDALIPSLLARKSDVIMASMRITDDRKKKVLFTNKYYQTPARFVAAKNADFTIDQAGMKDKVIGVQQGTIHDRYVTDKFGAVAEIKRYTGQDEVYIDMQNGRLDATFGNADQLSLAFLDKAEGKSFEFKGQAVTDKAYIGEGTALALRKQDQELAEKFNQAIVEIRQNGTYDKIAAKYFSFDIYGENL
ncbi:ABC transporter substrate-binding protein [Vibrio diazotrophicus]|jgi:arginine/ornithine transport system substrate-binding protein|uniref:ABC transporter substrate-binding protein n=1 Tax=Vibrio diazotrophicus TaxID=685 RepID=A0ABX4WFC2_VIBDI|nr:ABC transporter substrate-binding protein [Vibrio diazotrophicus]PNH90903.1 ABC transporter substrate-binding protein [Vibrio diazotrophicus]PNH94014.1 ABC transporter substrate-binding protein [Vibrio diazotrophicus]PNH98602.1 ABC transporter substrate-binding protein [Vibrio diazotrophicus]PNI03537.1 ABC transporter substrate-binding protein [Vibrio diazotrophicus]